MPSTPLGDQVEHDLDLLLAAAMLAGADIFALELAAELGLGLHAAVAGLIEERIVHVLRHQRERELVRLRRRHAGEGGQTTATDAVPIRSFFIPLPPSG